MNCVFCPSRAEYEAWLWCDSDDEAGPHRLVCAEHLKELARLMSIDGAAHTEYLHYWHIALRRLGN
jgi:hypothetical protein